MFNDTSVVAEDKILASLEQDIHIAEEALERCIKEQAENTEKYLKQKGQITSLSSQIKKLPVGEAQKFLQVKKESLLKELTHEHGLQLRIEEIKIALSELDPNAVGHIELMEHLISLNSQLKILQDAGSNFLKRQLESKLMDVKNKRLTHIVKKYVAISKQKFILEFEDMHDSWQSIYTDADFSLETEEHFKKFNQYFNSTMLQKFIIDFVNSALQIVDENQKAYLAAVDNLTVNVIDEDLQGASELEINVFVHDKMIDLFAPVEDQINYACVARSCVLIQKVIKEIATSYVQDKIATCNKFLELLDSYLLMPDNNKLETNLRQRIQNDGAFYLRRKTLYETISTLNLEKFDEFFERLQEHENLLQNLFKDRLFSYQVQRNLTLQLETEQIPENKYIAQLALEICRLELKQQERNLAANLTYLEKNYNTNSNSTIAIDDGFAGKVTAFTQQVFDVRLTYAKKISSLTNSLAKLFKLSEDKPNLGSLTGDQISEIVSARVAELANLRFLKEYYELYLQAAREKQTTELVKSPKMILLALQIYHNHYKTEEVVAHIKDKSSLEELSTAIEEFEKFHEQTNTEAIGNSIEKQTPSLALLMQIRRLLRELPTPNVIPDLINNLGHVIEVIKNERVTEYSDWRTEDYDGRADDTDEETNENVSDDSSTPRRSLPPTPSSIDEEQESESSSKSVIEHVVDEEQTPTFRVSSP